MTNEELKARVRELEATLERVRATMGFAHSIKTLREDIAAALDAPPAQEPEPKCKRCGQSKAKCEEDGRIMREIDEQLERDEQARQEHEHAPKAEAATSSPAPSTSQSTTPAVGNPMPLEQLDRLMRVASDLYQRGDWRAEVIETAVDQLRAELASQPKPADVPPELEQVAIELQRHAYNGQLTVSTANVIATAIRTSAAAMQGRIDELEKLQTHLKSEIRAHRQAHQETSRECVAADERAEAAEAELAQQKLMSKGVIEGLHKELALLRAQASPELEALKEAAMAYDKRRAEAHILANRESPQDLHQAICAFAQAERARSPK